MEKLGEWKGKSREGMRSKMGKGGEKKLKARGIKGEERGQRKNERWKKLEIGSGINKV